MRKPILFVTVSVLTVLAATLALPTRSGSSAVAEAVAQASAQLVDQGRGELSSGNFAKAIRFFEQAATANPKNAQAFSYIGRSYHEAGLNDRANRFYGIALTINPDEIKALDWSGQLDLVDDDVEGANEKLARLERICGRTCPEFLDLKSAINNQDTD